MISLATLSDRLRALTSLTCAGITSFIGPVLPYGILCTSMIIADLVSARMLASRVRRRNPMSGDASKFSSRRLGVTLVTLAKTYALLLLSHGVDCVIVEADSSFSMMQFSAALICFWQLWSILENEASANDATWARISRKILIDKTERHLGIDLSDLTRPASTADRTHTSNNTET